MELVDFLYIIVDIIPHNAKSLLNLSLAAQEIYSQILENTDHPYILISDITT